MESLYRASAMAKRLYVGNLKYTVTSEKLQELFEQYGAVSSAQVLSDRETGRSRGFGFVEMLNDDEAEAAIESSGRPGSRRPPADGQRSPAADSRWAGGGGEVAAIAVVAAAIVVAAATAAAMAKSVRLAG